MIVQPRLRTSERTQLCLAIQRSAFLNVSEEPPEADYWRARTLLGRAKPKWRVLETELCIFQTTKHPKAREPLGYAIGPFLQCSDTEREDGSGQYSQPRAYFFIDSGACGSVFLVFELLRWVVQSYAQNGRSA
jgi:hypothetical protein